MKMMKKLLKNGVSGFTLVELMIVLGIIGLLVALALPSYGQFMRKANRGEAQQLMLNYANVQEIWRSNNPTYGDSSDIAVPTHDKYTFTVSGTSATAYLITADPTGDQAYDKDQDKSCDPLTLDQSATKGPQHVVSGVNTTFCLGN